MFGEKALQRSLESTYGPSPGGRGSGLYSCYFVGMGVGLVHVEALSDNAGKKRAKDKT